MSRTPEYRVWKNMRTRCNNPNRSNYDYYGGRGIRVSPEWESFEQFIEDMGSRPSRRHTLERIDNDGPYSSANCRWATRSEQMNNFRRNRCITLDGRTQTTVQWSREHGLDPHKVTQRLHSGWSERDAILTPAGEREGLIEMDGLRLTAAEWSRRLGIGATTIRARLRRGYPVEDVLHVGRFRPVPGRRRQADSTPN